MRGLTRLRSQAVRLAAEIVLVPSAFTLDRWNVDDTDGAVVAGHLNGPATRRAVQIRLDACGRVTKVWLERWGAPGGQPLGWYPFVAIAPADGTFGGVTIPAEQSPADGVFHRATITHAAFH